MRPITIILLLIFGGCASVDKPAPQAIDSRREAAEAIVLYDARRLAAACQQYMLESATESVQFAIDSRTGAVSGPINPFVDRITQGTQVVDGTFEIGGTFSLQNDAAFGGAVAVFNDEGRRCQ